MDQQTTMDLCPDSEPKCSTPGPFYFFSWLPFPGKNRFGLYAISGNLWDCTAGRMGADDYCTPGKITSNPTGPPITERHGQAAMAEPAAVMISASGA